jgi:hypothetical protein
MNIIQYLQQNKNYLAHAQKALTIDFDTIDIDCSKGETDNTLFIFIEKNNMSFDEAMSILTMKQKMLNEEWDDLELYNKDDIALWASMLAKEYGNAIYYENISEDEFLNDHFMHRLQLDAGIQSIYFNDKQINFKSFQEIIPCKKTYLKIAKSSYTRLEIEYYLETDMHFVLMNWYTTA